MKKERIVYFDYLRVLATVSVVFLHTAIQFWYSDDPRGLDWNIGNFYSCFVRWGVPIFLMISGALFLSREIPTKTLYTKYIARMAVAFLVWSVIYAVSTPLVSRALNVSYPMTLYTVVRSIISGYYHMWYIPMIVGIYMLLPLIRQIVKSETLTRYLMVLTFVFGFVILQARDMANVFFSGMITKIANACYDALDSTGLLSLSGYAFYFILGYLLSRRELTKKQRYIIYALGVVGLIATILLSVLASYGSGEACGVFFYAITVNVLFTSMAVFTWFRYMELNREKWNALMAKLSKYSFGVYLIHVFVMETLQKLGLHIGLFTKILSIPVVTIVVVVISYFISWGLNQIPVVKKWIV